MRKSLMFVMLGIISFLGINSVSADTYSPTNSFISLPYYINYYNTYSSQINSMISSWESNYSTQYKYYFIVIDPYIYEDTENDSIISDILNSPVYLYYGESPYIIDDSFWGIISDSHRVQWPGNPSWSFIKYDPTTDDYLHHNANDSQSPIEPPYILQNNIQGLTLLKSNGAIYHNVSDFDTISFLSYYNSDLDINIAPFTIKDGDVFPDIISLTNGNYKPIIPNSYTEIDLNKYPYIILSLKDYTPRDTFESTIYVKGQLCATTLYNYGMEEKKDYVSGYQTQPCHPYFNNFVPFTTYIKSEDIINHAVYYYTSNNKTKPNFVAVDTSVYDITYITSDKKDDPYISIGGKNYPALPYDSLTDSATLTEKNGISNEWTCAKYDTDCLENSSGININDLFDKPLEFLKELWSSITSIFEVITEFLSLLPETMQSFLYLSFMVAIVLGLLKLIL